MKITLQTICLVIALVCLSCKAAPPYVPAPVANASSLTWNANMDTNVTAVVIHAYAPEASTWAQAVTIPVPQTTAVGVLTNYPSGTAFCATAINGEGAESLPSNQVTNNIVVSPNQVVNFQLR